MNNSDDETTEIRAAIADSRLTKVAISELIGMPYSSLNRKLSGHASFTLQEVRSLAKVLNVPMWQLLPKEFRREPASA